MKAVIQLVLPAALSSIALAAPALAGSESDQAAPPASGLTVSHVADIEWGALNPARGALSPRAATLWGDRNGASPSGFLVRFADGFSSPPHIHNVTYRAVVIDGSVHNDDPAATPMWMEAGSFWTQPRGEAHITAAQGQHNLALVEIDNGPYLVRPPEQAVDSGERSLNLDARNVVWQNASDRPDMTQPAKLAYLWGELGEGQWRGAFIKLPAGFSGALRNQAETLHAVIISGEFTLAGHDRVLAPGSYFGVKGSGVESKVQFDSSQETLIYLRSNGTSDQIE